MDEKSKKTIVTLTVFVIILAITVCILLVLNKNKNKVNEESGVITQLADKKVEDLFKEFYYSGMGSDMFAPDTKGYMEIDDNYKLFVSAVTAGSTSQECAELATNDSNFKLIKDSNGDYYELEGDEFAGSTFYCPVDEPTDEFFDYNTVNKAYKRMFGGEAPKKTFTKFKATYYYTKSKPGYLVGYGNIGCSQACVAPLTAVKDYEITKDKLYVNIYMQN